MRAWKASSNGAEGFSLVETLIAATIVIVALAGLTQLLVAAAAAHQRATSRTLATVLAEEKLEELLSSDGESTPGTDRFDARGQWIGAGDPTHPEAVYVRRWFATTLVGVAGASMLLVAVTPPRHIGGGEVVQLMSVKTSRLSRR
jgi:Tfp pilus assembly protein PilV